MLEGAPTTQNFIRTIITEDVKNNKNDGRVMTRFPPEPNGYLHIGHAKSLCLNFGLAAEFGGACNLRFDDTNPTKEDVEYVDSIMEDVRWLGFNWGDHTYYASDYFDQLFEYAVMMIKDGRAYVDSLTAEEIRQHRGTLTEAGKNSPFRDRSIEENLDLFTRMRAGEFEDGKHVLRAKIDMASPNMNMRDPTLYRIRKFHHHRTGDKWCVYPMYDFTHGLSDALEGITHSICTLEFENHRPLYDWLLDVFPVPCHPQQIEFNRLNVNYTMMSKRKLLDLVNKGHVRGWDDPRMPTLAAMRRRGYTPESIKNFVERSGVSKSESCMDLSVLEESLRDDLNPQARRVMAVTRPIKVVLENYPEDKVEELDCPYFPDDPPRLGYRKVPFSRVLYIERDDFMEDPPKKYFRLFPGNEVRLRWAYLIRCQQVIKDDQGEIIELRCTYDPDTLGGNAPDGRKVRGTIHWVSAEHSLPAELRLYDRLFSVERPGEERDYQEDLNPKSLEVLTTSRIERSLGEAQPGDRFQFERQGYFCVDKDSRTGALVFNRTVTLRDGWAKMVAAGKT